MGTIIKIKKSHLMGALIGLANAPALYAAGFAIDAVSPYQLSMAGAGEFVDESHTSGMSGNPAVVDFAKGGRISVGLVRLFPKAQLEQAKVTFGLQSLNANDAELTDDFLPNETLPSLYFVRPLNDKMAYGLSVDSPYGSQVDYHFDSNLTGAQNLGSVRSYSKIRVLDLHNTFSYKVKEGFNVGFGVHVLHAEEDFLRRAEDNQINYSASDMAVGYQVGMLWSSSDSRNQFGLSYQSAAHFDLEPNARIRTQQAGVPSEVNLSHQLTLPRELGFGYRYQVTDRATLMLSAKHAQWSKASAGLSPKLAVLPISQLPSSLASVIESNGLKIPDPTWKNTWRYAVGVRYVLSPELQVSTGFAHDQSILAGNNVDGAAAWLPVQPQNWLTLGVGYTPNDKWRIDTVIAHRRARKAPITFDSNVAGQAVGFKARSSGHALAFGLQATYAF